MSNLGRGYRWRSGKKEMHMVWLDIERANTPLPRFTDAAKFLFNKGGKLANQNLFPVFGTPDKVVASLYVTCLVCCVSIHSIVTDVLAFEKCHVGPPYPQMNRGG